MEDSDNHDERAHDPPHLNEYMGFLLNYAGRRVQRQVDAALAPLGLRAQHIGLLSLLARAPLSQIALGERLHVDRTTMVSKVDELEEAGLVIRTRNPRDRRAYHITLTERGHTILHDAHARIIAAEAEALAPLTPAERDTLRTLLARLTVSGE